MKRKTDAVVAGGTASVVAAMWVMGCSSTGLSSYEQGGQTQSAYIRAVTERNAAAAPAVTVGPGVRPGTATTAGVDGTPARITPAGPVKPPPPFKGPANIAVAQVGEVAPPESLMTTLRQHPQLFGRVNVVPARLDPSNTSRYYARHRSTATAVDLSVRDHIGVLCDTATSMGMNYLLLVGGTIDSETNATPLSLLNITIVGAFIVPSDQTRATAKATGALIDLPTRQVVAISSAELDENHLTPAVSTRGENTQLFRRMADKVAAKLAAQVVADCGGPATSGGGDAKVEDERKVVSKAR
jgi:hypothetical protein